MMTDNPDDELRNRLIHEERLRREIARDFAEPAKRTWLSENAKWLIAALLIPLVTWIYGVNQERIAERNRIRETAISDARNDVSALTTLLPALTDPDPGRSSIALAILTRLKDAQRGSTTARQVFDAIEAQIRARANSADPEERSEASVSAEAISRASGDQAVTAAPVQLSAVRPPPNAAVAEVRPNRVFIQVWSEGQLEAADRVRATLREAGVPVPAIENVSRLAARAGAQPTGQVRYFNDADLAAAQWAVNRVRAATGQTWTVLRARTGAEVPAGQIELWWPRSVRPVSPVLRGAAAVRPRATAVPGAPAQ